MKITFVLPGLKVRAVGAHLVIYRLANELVHRGHQLRLVHSRRIHAAEGLVERAKASTWRARKKLHYRGRIPWANIDPAVEVILTPDIREAWIPDGDAVFATDCTVTPVVATYGEAKGTKFNLIQAYEYWTCGEEGVHASWRLPLHRIVVSEWLREAVSAAGGDGSVTHIPPGVELDLFRIVTPPRERAPAHVGMLAHNWSIKGTTYAVDALREVREAIPELQVVAFGRHASTRQGLPSWIQFVRNPTRAELAELYNSLAIFLHSSLEEGWPLPPAEALACGCALVASDSRGVRDYAIDGETALLVPVRNSGGLATAVVELIRNEPLRVKLAVAGRRAIERFPLQRSADAFEALLVEVAKYRATVRRREAALGKRSPS
jgi:glycosyltransferase involved in cell wall biosynthesis